MREVEVKAHVRNKQELTSRLREQGALFSNGVTQNDTVYVKEIGSLEMFLANTFFLRIRETGEQTTFTLKYHPGRNSSDIYSMPIEHEVLVSDATELQTMLTLLGFVPAMQIIKTRETAHIGEYEICMDEVEGLGSFIELEKIIDPEHDTEPVIDEMKRFLLGLGITEEDIGVKRYDIQVLEKVYSDTKDRI